ncbi:hypothetical protein FHX74_003389 [Friedmanniella endophytica]|uniref:Golgi phosphoprotein 3 (GPP34) n=1 Tax=Microlunatus kandeliicorticis TaxID=1759536 RepID=A0A7W3P785_9ACTN|nr:GPP34 family phosphoprotein [Microlunatus kandeliicorticis]MBA8795748.1 hypothetical protein [Microlunatus kandeliicorticis]
MEPLIAEDLLLLLLDDESGKLQPNVYLDLAVGSALLVQLALDAYVRPDGQERRWTAPRIEASSTTPDDPVLAEALAVVAEKPRTGQDLIGRLGKKRRDVLLDRLVQAGVLERREDKLLGLFPRDRWPTRDASRETALRGRLADALLRGGTPDDRTAALIGLLSALDLAHKVVDRQGVPAGDVKRRARELAEKYWAAGALRDAIQAAQSAVIAASVVATTAATTTATS